MLSIESIQSIDWLKWGFPRRMRAIQPDHLRAVFQPVFRQASFQQAKFSTKELRMLGIGQKFPAYSLTGVVSNDQAKAFQPFDQDTHKGKWRVVFFWPKDFTFVCPTEIAAFGKLDKEF